MDFGKFDTKKGGEEGATIELHGPDGEKLEGVTMTVKGTDSTSWEKHSHRTNRRRKVKVRSGGVEIDSAEEQENLIDRMAECVISWDGIDYDGKSPFECNKANAKRLFEDLPWLREQVYAFMQDRANFLGKASID